ncbi:MAG: dinuclear metal center YbgI/SA1388 family protein [Oceanicoccus sp.]|jgi:dinuclear metal center YbgI/SA1388 family protein
MPIDRNILLDSLNDLLKPEEFDDYCPNGLQVEGTNQISTVVCGVTASQWLIDRAVALNADAILVHHGFFWKGENQRVIGMKYRRLQGLIKNNINLIAYHLPLDAHPEYGNNVQLATLLGVEVTGSLNPGDPRSVGNVGRLRQPKTAKDFCAHVSGILGREPLLISGGDHLIDTIGWCTGSAHGYIEQASNLGLDAYLSGEISEPTVHSARELGVHYIAAGHHATERYGVRSLGEYLANKFGITCTFVDEENPV